jgi:extracellular elastinolytic metalloproteinase
MPRQIDVRTTTRAAAADRADDDAAATRRSVAHRAAEEASAALPGEHRVEVASFDGVTGNPAVVVSHEAAATPEDFVGRAQQHLQRIGAVLGFGPARAPEFVADPEHEVTSSGAVAVHLQQLYKGIQVYDGAQTVRFGPDGTLLEVAGRSYTVDADIRVAPTVSAEQALRLAAAYLATGTDEADAGTDPFGEPLTEPTLDLREFDPVVRTVAQDQPDRLTTFDAPPLPSAVSVSLMWFPLDGGLRLAWHTRLQLPGGPVYRAVVDAAEERILLFRRLSQAITGRAEVVLSAGQPRQPVTLPQPLDTHGAPVPAGLPAGFPDPWLIDASTHGSCVRAVLAAGSAPVAGTRQGDEVTFAPADQAGQLVVNLFALCSVMHDVLYLLGFREADGNFQVDNHGRGGRSVDPVFAVVHPGAVWGTANMGTPPDGRAPAMNMGLVQRTGRHTALDPDVVYHEYTHGLTNRLVGGPMNDRALDDVQSGGMGEGWGDFFACIVGRKTVVADWVTADPGGFRRFRYDDAFPDSYADLGTGRYVDDNVHAIGEIWCAALMTLSRRLGAWPTAQLVVDALKLTPANPSLLAARDAILLAADQNAAARGDTPAARAQVVHSVWEVFARYGMGPGARTDGAALLTGIVADFQPPPRPTVVATVRAEANPLLPIPDDDRTGVSSTVTPADAGPIRELSVTTDIRHTYRGDLVVVLVAPDGRTVTLHDRAGGRSRDLRKTWRSSEHAGLAALHGAPVGGLWQLRVADHAPADVGRLRSWSLEAQLGEARPVTAAHAAPGLTIPEAAEGITSELVLTETGTISALVLDLDITHQYVADLEVVLRGPDRRKAVLHRRDSTDAEALVLTYTSDPDGPLHPFVGKPITGRWTLHVSDRARRDAGKLNRWTLKAVL